MATNYFVVLTQWSVGGAPNQVGTKDADGVSELQQACSDKGWEMIQAGKMVRADCPTKNDSLAQLDGKFTDGTPFHPIVPSNLAVSYGRSWFSSGRDKYLNAIATSRDRSIALALPDEFNNDETPKFLRIFVTEAAANEWNDFALSLGATFSIVLTPAEYEPLDLIPDDSIIAQYIGVPA
jgi:hypothetical protein